MTLIVGIALLLVPLVALAALIWWRAMFRRSRRSATNESTPIGDAMPNNIPWTPLSARPVRSFETEMAISAMTLFPEEHGINDM